MTKLSDIQRILLSTASCRDDGSLLPAPATITGKADRIAMAIAGLLKRNLVVEQDAPDAANAWRTDGGRGVGAFLTDQGRVAIGSEEPSTNDDATSPGLPAGGVAGAISGDAIPPIVASPRGKIGEVLVLLGRAQGASLDEMVTATGWLPHTTRAALTGLRKKGHVLVRGKVDGETRYTLEDKA